MITPIIFSPPSQRYLCERLVKHCLDLDGTKVEVITALEPSLKYPAICNWAFRKACEIMKGRAFVWLEADSIPTQVGWLKVLNAAWEEAQSFGKSIVWTTDSSPPFDLCTGIGVYGPDALDLVPDGVTSEGFDGYLFKHHADKIHKTPLIQHTYGRYDTKGQVTLHRKPSVRDGAVIFHKDQYQDLISVEKHFGHSGDLGDIIFALALVKASGGGFMWLYDRPFTKVISRRFDVIAPLLTAQPYIVSTAVSSGLGVQYDLSKFRSHHQVDRTLLMAQCLYATRAYQLPVVRGAEAWLTATPSKATKSRVVIARSPRYHNDQFPWKRVLAHYGAACVFIGLREEHSAFEAAFGSVEYLKTENLLDVAEAIAGSDLFIGNQSSPNAVAEGLKHPRILEVSDWTPDCIYPNHGVLCYDGFLSELPAAGGKEREVFEKPPAFRKLDLVVCPPRGWRYPEATTSTHINVLAAEVAKQRRIQKDEALRLVYDHNCGLNPEFFKDSTAEAKYSRVLKALANAQ